MRAATKVVRLLLAATLATVGLFVCTPPAGAATQAVMMDNYAFSPATLTVHAGDTVTWTNHDQAPHDVTTTSAPVAIKSSMMSTGQSFTYTFTTAGTYSYYCSIHPDMRAQVIVQPAAAVAPAPAPASTAPPRTTVRRPASSTARASAVPQTQAPAPTDGQPAAAQPEQPQQPEQQAQPQQVVSAPVAPTTSTTLDPMLIVAGVAAGIVVLCLLLLGSRRES